MSVIRRPELRSHAGDHVSVDTLLAFALALSQAATVMVGGGGPLGLRLLGALAAFGFLALAWRRRHPVTVLVITFAVVFVQELVAPNQQSPQLFIAILLASYSLGADAGRRALAEGTLIGISGVVIGHALGPSVRGFSDASADVFFALLLVLAPALIGRLVRWRSDLARRLDVATGRLRALREQRISTALSRERERIGEQLEQVMLSGLDMMETRAEVASREAVVALEQAARKTLGGMRSLLAGLHSDSSELGPTKTLPELHARVAHALAGELQSEGRADHQPPAPGHLIFFSESRIDLGLSILAALLAVAALIAAWAANALHGARWLDALLAMAAVVPIAWARRAPLLCASISLLAFLGYVRLAAPADPLSGVTPTGLLIVYPFAIGARHRLRVAIAGAAVCLVGAAAALVVNPHVMSDQFSELPLSAAIIFGSWAAGWVLGSRTRMVSALADTAVEIEREQNALAHERVRQERAHIARELHDAFAHSMTVIVVQAQAARRVWTSDPLVASKHASVLRATVKEALGDLRELISAVSQDDQRTPASVRLWRLIDQSRAAGVDVELSIEGLAQAVSAEIEHTAYRIVQEAITNAVRHAPGTAVRVRMRYDESSLSIEVTNGPPQREPEKGYGAGEGLRGMRERAARCGGEVEAARQLGGGFRVRARLPVIESR